MQPIVDQNVVAGRQRQRFTTRDEGGEAKTESDSAMKPARAKQALLAVLLGSTSATASTADPVSYTHLTLPTTPYV